MGESEGSGSREEWGVCALVELFGAVSGERGKWNGHGLRDRDNGTVKA